MPLNSALEYSIGKKVKIARIWAIVTSILEGRRRNYNSRNI